MNINKKTIFQRFQALNTAQKRTTLRWFFLFLVFGTLFLVFTCLYLFHDKRTEDTYWTNALQDEISKTENFQAISKNAVTVTAGTYVENLMQLSFKDNSYRIIFNVWFSWEGHEDLDMASNFRIYKGNINKMQILEDVITEDYCYQLIQVDATISKDFWTVRFPLESHQLRFYIEPSFRADQVILQADTENSIVLPVMTATGFNLSRSAVSVNTAYYESTQNSPTATVPYSQELCTSLEINRAGFGLYLKCFIALAGTLIWVFIMLFICTYHNIDPIRLIPTALFGAVTNIMVGANMLPESMQTGLLEFVNIGGVLIILACTLCVIKINRIRSAEGDNEFAFLFGRTMFGILLLLTLTGSFLYPLVSYRF